MAVVYYQFSNGETLASHDILIKGVDFLCDIDYRIKILERIKGLCIAKFICISKNIRL